MESELATVPKKTLFIGIDIGFVNLAICLLYSCDKYVHNADEIQILAPALVNDQMDLKAISDFLPGIEATVLMEDVHSFPKQGVASTFKFGFAKGVLVGICKEKGYTVHLVSPQWWKKDTGLLGKKKSDSVRLAKVFSEEKYHPLLKNHNSAEAFLLARQLKIGHHIFCPNLKTI